MDGGEPSLARTEAQLELVEGEGRLRSALIRARAKNMDAVREERGAMAVGGRAILEVKGKHAERGSWAGRVAVTAPADRERPSLMDATPKTWTLMQTAFGLVQRAGYQCRKRQSNVSMIGGRTRCTPRGQAEALHIDRRA